MEVSSGGITQKFIRNVRKGKHKFASLYPIYGLWGTLRLVLKNTLFLEIVFRLDKELSTPDTLVEPKIPMTIEIYDKNFDLNSWSGKEEILKIRGTYGLEQFAERFARGDLCFAAYSNSDFVGFVWVQFPPVTEAGYPLQPDEAYTHDGWTFDRYRGKRTLPVIQQAIMNYVRQHQKDIRKLVTHVATRNKASLSGDQRSGYIIIRRELTIVIFGFHHKLILT